MKQLSIMFVVLATVLVCGCGGGSRPVETTQSQTSPAVYRWKLAVQRGAGRSGKGSPDDCRRHQPVGQYDQRCSACHGFELF
jgi:hypothetical protein